MYLCVCKEVLDGNLVLPALYFAKAFHFSPVQVFFNFLFSNLNSNVKFFYMIACQMNTKKKRN